VFTLTAERQDIGLSNFLYGLGAGLFFVGYFVAQLPSNVIVTRVGAPRWLALLLFTWGLVTMCTAGAPSHLLSAFSPALSYRPGARSALKRCVRSWHYEGSTSLQSSPSRSSSVRGACAFQVACAAAAIHNTTEFFVLRILLGLAEGAAQPVHRSLQQWLSSLSSCSAISLPKPGCHEPTSFGHQS
jgi:MFS family permease